jgi:hypothetical protein
MNWSNSSGRNGYPVEAELEGCTVSLWVACIIGEVTRLELGFSTDSVEDELGRREMELGLPCGDGGRLYRRPGWQR